MTGPIPALPPALAAWDPRFAAFMERSAGAYADVAHDLEHTRRVVANARALAAAEVACLEVVLPAAWLHDCVSVPKHSPERALASRMAADAATTFLHEAGYPAEHLDAIAHAIHAHSFSAAVEPRTLEAAVVQDADRLDALGAIGVARTLMLGGALGLPLYDAAEPFPLSRTPDDRRNVIDHFHVKLLGLAATMRTAAGRREAEARTVYMRGYLEQLRREIEAAGG
jgi:uncharacterized protein